MLKSVLLLGFLLTVSISYCQLPTAAILGVVEDHSGSVVPGAEVTVRNVETSQTRSSLTGPDGSYRFSALQVGTYERQVEHAGFQKSIRKGLSLSVTQEAVVNVSLEIGPIDQTISVTADSPLVNTTSGSL